MENANYLGITLNLNNDSYHPYRKPSQETNYIYTNSNHPPSINKEIPRSIEEKLSILSSSKKIVQESVIYYKKTQLQHQQPKDSNQIKKKRKRNIIWFNPPHTKSVKTNIGRIFLKLISKHFSSNHKLVKIFSKKNPMKLSCSCMSNISSKINSNNKKYYYPSQQSHKNYATSSLKKIQ